MDLPINIMFSSRDDYNIRIQCPFCILLVTYDKFKRSKLNAADLSKISNKYSSNPPKLLKDLSGKFEEDDIPKYVYIQQVMYILSKYGIKDAAYVQLLPSNVRYILDNPDYYKNTVFHYQGTCDFTHANFDPLVAFRNKFTATATSLSIDVLTHASLRPRDNMSKVKHLVPGHEACVDPDARGGGGRPKGGSDNNSVTAKEVLHPFQRIARDTLACADNKCSLSESTGAGSGTGDSMVGSSTYSLLYELLQEGKCYNKHYSSSNSTRSKSSMARVVIRARSGIRGTVLGYLGGFDAHFNLFLTEVTEEYLCSEGGSDVARVGEKRRVDEYHNTNNDSNGPDSQSNGISTGSGGKDGDVQEDEEEPYAFFLLKKLKSPRVKVRHFKQLFVRGDGIVSISKSSAGG